LESNILINVHNNECRYNVAIYQNNALLFVSTLRQNQHKIFIIKQMLKTHKKEYQTQQSTQDHKATENLGYTPYLR